MIDIATSTRPSRTRSRLSARVAIRTALQQAAKRLADAAQGRLSEQSLHELRIACRRAESALRLCRDVVEPQACGWLRRRLKTLRRVCNEARDDNVLCEWIRRQHKSSTKGVCQAIAAHRDKVQPRIQELARRLTKPDGFRRRAQQVVRDVPTRERPGRIAHDLGQRLFAEVSRLVKSLPMHRDDGAALHRLRIAGKRLRYASDLVATIFPAADLAELRERLHELQDRLGPIHDQLVAARRLRKHFQKNSDRAVQTLVSTAEHQANRGQRDFWRWWQALPIERMLADTTAEILLLMDSTPSPGSITRAAKLDRSARR